MVSGSNVAKSSFGHIINYLTSEKQNSSNKKPRRTSVQNKILFLIWPSWHNLTYVIYNIFCLLTRCYTKKEISKLTFELKYPLMITNRNHTCGKCWFCYFLPRILTPFTPSPPSFLPPPPPRALQAAPPMLFGGGFVQQKQKQWQKNPFCLWKTEGFNNAF